MARKANDRQLSTAQQELERAVRLVNEAKGQDDKARCKVLYEAIKVLMPTKRDARAPSEKISIPSTCESAKLEALLEELLDGPSRRLAVYGTLAPGEDNHHVLAQIQGTWQRGWVPGVLGRIGPYPAFQWKPRAKPIPVHVLASARLPHHWARLDRFEGAAYRRILAPVMIAGRGVRVANIYEGVDLC